MKKYLLLILMSIPQLLISQTELKVLVYEKDTKTTLAFANIILKENNLGNATDIDGFATLKTKRNYIKNDILTCSYIGYKEEIINLTLPKKDTLKIYLESEHVTLEEVTVTANIDNSSGKELIKKVVDRIEENYGKELSNLEAFYQEKVFENKKLIELNQSLNTIIYDGYPQKKYAYRGYKNYWKYETLWEYQNSNIQNKKQKLLIGFPQFFKYYNSKKDECIVLTKRISDNLSNQNIRTSINGGPLALTSLDKVKFLADYLDPKLIDDYLYIRKESKLINDIRCFSIGFKPKSKKKIYTQAWDEKIEFALYSGTIYVSKEDYAVVRIESILERNESIEHYIKNEPWQIFPHSISLEINYQKSNNTNWHLKSIKSNQEIKANESKKFNVLENYVCTRELIICRKTSDNLIEIDKNDTRLLRDIEFANLREFPSKYKKELWNNIQNNRETTELTKTEVESLSKNLNLAEQFLKNN